MENSENTQYKIRKNRKNLVTGMALIAVGTLFLLDRLDIIEVTQFWHLWPAFIALFGINQMVSAEKNAQFVQGCFQVFLAFWLYASLENLWGWNFSTSWPLLLIGYGLSMVLGGLIKNQK